MLFITMSKGDLSKQPFRQHQLRLLFAIAAFATLLAAPAFAWNNGAAGAQEEPEAEEVVDEEALVIAEDIFALETNIADVERRLEVYTEMEAAAAEGLTDISAEALHSRIAALRKLQTAYQRHLSALREYEDILERHAIFEAGMRDFQHLDEEPPYTMAFLDNLRDMVDHKQMDVEAEQLSLRALEELVNLERNDIPNARAALNRANERLRTARQDERMEAQFEVATVKLLLEANEAELSTAEMELKRTHTQIELLELELELAKRKVTLAATQTKFLQGELDEIVERQEAVIDTLAKEAQETRNEIDRYRARVPGAELTLTRATEPDAQSRARAELDLVRRQVDAARIKMAILESLQDYERAVIQLWELRFQIANPAMATERLDWAAITARLRENLEVFNKERGAGERRAMSLRGQIAALERRLESWSEENGDKRIAEQNLAVLGNRIETRNRIQLRMAQIVTLTERIIEETRQRQVERSLTERVSDIWIRSYAMVTNAFDHEIMEIGDESITGRKVFYMVLILVFGVIISRLVTRYIQSYALGKLKLRSNVVLIIAKLTNYILFIIVVYMALNYVNIPLTMFTFMGGAIALGIGFGAQNLINNFLSGLILMGEQPIRMGDIVEIEGKLGVITNIGARASRLRMFTGFDLLIPNSKFLETSVINWTLSDSKVRLQVEVGAAYGSPTREVANLMLRAASEHGLVLNDPEPKVIFESFGDNSLIFSVYFWIQLGPSADGRVVMSDVRHRIDKLFKEANIAIAFPQRDIHIENRAPLEVRLVPEAAAADKPETPKDKKEDAKGIQPGKLPG